MNMPLEQRMKEMKEIYLGMWNIKAKDEKTQFWYLHKVYRAIRLIRQMMEEETASSGSSEENGASEA
jgi:hypothetical protein